ncbi:MAG: hypothetical protein ABW171_17485, partial [Steroidobacter sp.]
RTTNRVRNKTTDVRDRATSKVDRTRDVTKTTASNAAATAEKKPDLLGAAKDSGKDVAASQPAAPTEPLKLAQPDRMLNVSGDADGSASASRDGVAADGRGAANASRK